MKEAKVVRLKHPEYLCSRTIEQKINEVFQFNEDWSFVGSQFVPIPVEKDKLISPMVNFGFLLLFFEREIAVSPEQITIAVEEFRESLASLLD